MISLTHTSIIRQKESHEHTTRRFTALTSTQGVPGALVNALATSVTHVSEAGRHGRPPPPSWVWDGDGDGGDGGGAIRGSPSNESVSSAEPAADDGGDGASASAKSGVTPMEEVVYVLW